MKLKRKGRPVAIIMGSDSDLTCMRGATEPLKNFGIGFELIIVSAHRTPKFMYKFAAKARDHGFKIIIAGAGGAAHLPGMIAALTPLPVIGVPVAQSKLNGLDSLLSIVQMPRGVPVATVAIDNAFNAGILAARILAVSDRRLLEKVVQFQRSQELKVKAANERLRIQTLQVRDMVNPSQI